MEGSVQRSLHSVRKKTLTKMSDDRTYQHFRDVKAIIWRAYESSDTLSEFNAIFMSIICNECWGCQTSFVPAHEIQQYFRPAYSFLLQQSEAIKRIWNEGAEFFAGQGVDLKIRRFTDSDSLAWSICPLCFRRTAHEREIGSQELAACKACIGVIRPFASGLTNTGESHIAPRVILDDLLDYVALRISGGTGYIGGAEHRLMVDYVAQRLQIEPAPECLWTPRTLVAGPVEICHNASRLERASNSAKYSEKALEWLTTGKATILYYGIYVGFQRLRQCLDKALAVADVDHLITCSGNDISPGQRGSDCPT